MEFEHAKQVAMLIKRGTVLLPRDELLELVGTLPKGFYEDYYSLRGFTELHILGVSFKQELD